MNRIKPIILVALLLLMVRLTPAMAQTDSVPKVRPVTRATLYGIGTANVFDTYLSPQAYRGTELRIVRESTQQTRWMGGRLYRQTLFQANTSYTHNRVDNNNTLAALANWNWGLHYDIPLTPNFSLRPGALTDFNGGFVYNLRNGNNPAQARAYIDLDASVMALWNLRIKNYPVSLRYQLNVPVMGVMFMPEYGASYYEIFSEGNTRGIVNFTSVHNHPSLRQFVSADLPVGRLKVRVAYVWDAQQAEVNHIKVHSYSHAFMVGFVKEFVRL